MRSWRRRALAPLAAATLLSGLVPTIVPAASAAAGQTYIVLYRETASTAGAAALVGKAGGTVVATYPQIGVVIARSADAGFATSVSGNTSVEGVASTAGFAMKLDDDVSAGPGPGDYPNVPATDVDEPLWPLQWDMRQIHVDQAHAVTGGSPSVLVADLDTGLDFDHPDIAPNYDAANSTDCSSGAPATLPSNNDAIGHGTHTAGTIAAADNGIGVIGVAPHVRLAAIKSSNDDGFFFPEMVVCAFMWAGTHGVDVTNNSYFADPWLYNCKNDPVQRAIWKAEQRAIKFAMQQGVAVVASAGNENQDLAHPPIDVISPDNGTPIPRDVTNACLRIPAEIPGVVTVTATGPLHRKAYYSDYGIGIIDVAAPGGDRRFQLTAEAPNGRVLSTFPGNQYAYLQGTSMAGPHVVGVLALIESRYGPLTSGQAISILEQTATATPCEARDVVYPPQPPSYPGDTALCQGGAGYNGFYGHGEVNAFAAVSR